MFSSSPYTRYEVLGRYQWHMSSSYLDKGCSSIPRPLEHLNTLLDMLKNRKNAFMGAFLLELFGIFTMHVYQNYYTEQAMFGFHTPYDYYKPHYNLLVPYIHLVATLHMLKNDQKTTFYRHFLAF